MGASFAKFFSERVSSLAFIRWRASTRVWATPSDKNVIGPNIRFLSLKVDL